MNEPKYYCSFAQSKALKELGFREPCLFAWSSEGNFKTASMTISAIDYNSMIDRLSAPTRAQALNFFRAEFQLFGWVQPDISNSYKYYIVRPIGHRLDDGGFITWELAETCLLDRLLELAEKRK